MYKEVQGLQRNPCNENRIPAMRTGFIFPEGVPCKPSRLWICSAEALFFMFCLFWPRKIFWEYKLIVFSLLHEKTSSWKVGYILLKNCKNFGTAKTLIVFSMFLLLDTNLWLLLVFFYSFTCRRQIIYCIVAWIYVNVYIFFRCTFVM